MLAAGSLLSALDPGGVSVDLELLKGPSDSGTGGANLLNDGDFENLSIDFGKPGSFWRGGCWVWSKGLKDAAHRKRITDAQIRVIDDRSGVGSSRCAVIDTPDVLKKEQNQLGDPWMSSFITQSIGLPDSDTPVKYTLLFKVKGRTGKAAGINNFEVFVFFYDKLPGVAGSKATRRTLERVIPLPADYELRSLSFMAPPHTRKLQFNFTLYGQGRVFLDDVRLVKTPVPEAANIYVSPWSYLDNTYCIGEKQPGVILFGMQNEQRTKFKKLTLTLKIPAGFKFHSVHKNSRLIGVKAEPDGSSIVECGIQSFVANIPAEGHSTWFCPTVTLIPELKASAKLYPMTYQLSDGDWKGCVRSLNLKVIEPLQGKRPKYFITGSQMTHEFDLPAEKLPVLRDFLVRSGFNALYSRERGLSMAAKSAGLARYTEMLQLCDGYGIGGNANRTPESCFIQIDGKPFKRGNRIYTCPAEVYKRGKFYCTEVLKLFEKQLVAEDSTDHFMPNWEPYYLDYKGCFCERCREDFISWMNGRAKPEEIRAKWPKRIIADYRDAWVRFRSWQHGRLCATLEQDIGALGKKAGKESHFIPEIAYTQLTETVRSKTGFAQYSPLDYMGELSWLNSWGPYIFSNFTEKYIYRPGIHLVTYAAAEENKAFVRRHVKDPVRRPKLIAMPNGFQCGTWVTEPEAFAFEVLCFFVNRWEGAMGYFFPQGYDHRYWNALAKANKVMAEHEETVLKGDDVGQVKFIPATPLPKPFGLAERIHTLPSVAAREIFQFRSFRKNREIVAALGNFWQKGEFFAVMKTAGLAPKGKYTVNSSEGYSLGVFTGAALEKGILVHAGALRWNFFRILPGNAVKGRITSQDYMKSEMRKRLPGIRKMCAWEKAYAARMLAEVRANDPINDFKSVPELIGGPVKLKVVQVKGRDCLQITFPAGSMLLDPAEGGSVVSLKIGGREIVDKMGFGLVGFWSPRKVDHLVSKGYLIRGVKKTAQGVEVELARSVNGMEKAALERLDIVKTFLFTPGGMTVKARLTNNSVWARRFAFRFHNMPVQLAGPDGRAECGGVRFEREQSLKILRFGAAEKEIDTAYPVGKFLDAKEMPFSLRRAGYPELTVSLGGAPAYGVIFWDTGTSSTVEPIFRTVELAPGASREFVMNLKW